MGASRVRGTIILRRWYWEVVSKSFSRRRGWPPPDPPHRGEGICYCGNDSFQILIDLVVPKTDYTIALSFHIPCSGCIVRSSRIGPVLPTVDFNYELGSVPGKIGGIEAHRHLFTEMRVRKIFLKRAP